MHRWLILFACALTSFPSWAEDKADAPSLAPPPDRIETQAPNPADATVPDNSDTTPSVITPDPSAKEKIPSDGGMPDSTKTPVARDVPDVKEETPAYFARVDELRKHHDPVLAVDYLKEIATNGNTRPQYRSRAIIELADVLEGEGQEAEALCWLKIWGELFPGRREFAGVAYRIATLYTKMGMPDTARDAYYLVLAHAVNQGQVTDPLDLTYYNQLTTATLWGLAANEYQAGQWSRAAELFNRFRNEATTATSLSLEKAAFLQADCYYQLKQSDDAIKLYEETVTKHPFHPLAPQARLRLYHLDIMKGDTGKAQAELEALVWTVRTVWPKDEAYWQKQTAQLLLAINQKNCDVLPPLVKQSAQLAPEGKSWQDALNHYDALVSYQVVKTHPIMDSHANSFSKVGDQNSLEEENDLLAMNNRINQLLPPRSATTP